LMVELPEGPLRAAYAKEQAALSGLAVEVRQDPKQAALPIAEPSPVYFIPSLPERTYRVFLEVGQYPHKWRGGVVAILGPRSLAEPPLQGQSVGLLYPGKNAYLQDVTRLTEAQLDRRLQARLREGRKLERANFIADLAFERTILCRLLGEPIVQARVPWLDRWRGAVALDTDAARQALTAGQADAGKERTQRLGHLRADLALGAAILNDAKAAAKDAVKLARAVECLSRLAP
jgi:hypothetical protein